jgi:hypothetical protein
MNIKLLKLLSFNGRTFTKKRQGLKQVALWVAKSHTQTTA